MWVCAWQPRLGSGLSGISCVPPWVHQPQPKASVLRACEPLNASAQHSVLSDSATPWTAAYQATLSMRFPRQEYWSGLLFPPPGDLPDPEIKLLTPVSCLLCLLHWQEDSLPSSHLGSLKPLNIL